MPSERIDEQPLGDGQCIGENEHGLPCGLPVRTAGELLSSLENWTGERMYCGACADALASLPPEEDV